MSVVMRSSRRARAALVTALAGAVAFDLLAANTSNTGGGQGVPLGQPALGLRYGIAYQGVFPANGSGSHAAGSEPMIGEIRLFAFDFVPGGWLACNGQTVSKTTYQSLFDVIGTTYGGDGVTTFVIPDLRGRAAVGFDTGVGLTSHPIGEVFGASATSSSASLLPTHVHAMAGGAQTGSIGSGTSYSVFRPSLALAPLISRYGIFTYMSEVRLFSAAYPPNSWSFANGQLLLIAAFNALFAHLGTTYGGNGSTTFALPDLRGRDAIGAGQGPGLSLRNLGDQVGIETMTLATAQMTSHTHTTAAGATGTAGSTSSIDRMQPALTLRYAIAQFGVFPSTGSFNGDIFPLVGEIRPFAGNSIPDEFLLCEGQLMPISENETLFVLIGTTFGGDGQDTFALPDLRGRVPVGTGTGPGLPNVSMGETLGAEAASMTTNQMATHNHSQPAPEIDISGNAVNIVDGDITPNPLDFTAYPTLDPADLPVTRTFSIANSGLGDLTLSANLSASPAFTLISSPAGVVLPSGSTSFQVRFDPATEGEFTTTVTITNDDPNEAPYDFLLAGNGAVAPAFRRPGLIASTSLRVTKNTTNSSWVDLSWGPSCGFGVTGYAVYEGQLGNFTSHNLVPGRCNVAGPTSNGIVPGSGDRYFLLSAIDAFGDEEGSLGTSSSGTEHVRPSGACEIAADLAACYTPTTVGNLDGVSSSSTFEAGAPTPLPTLGWTTVSGTAQVFDGAGNGALIGGSAYGNYQVQYLTGVAVQPNSLYTLRVKMGFVAGNSPGHANYELQLGTSNAGTFSPLYTVTSTVTYAGNLYSNVISGTARIDVGTGGTVTGDQLAVRWRQVSTDGSPFSDYFGIDDVILERSN